MEQGDLGVDDLTAVNFRYRPRRAAQADDWLGRWAMNLMVFKQPRS